MLSKKKLKEIISAARLQTTLSEFILEKDYYVTLAISIIRQINNPYFRFIFSGGTSLSKGHKIINRMSEDIDFKIELINKQSELHRSALVKEMRSLRELILSSLKKAEFIFENDNIVVENEGKHITILMDYPSQFKKQQGLRPQILIEFTLSTLKQPTELLKINPIIHSLLSENVTKLEFDMSCTSVNETLAEKWVGLTRRIAAIKRGHLGKDDYLIRHLYDITTTNKSNKLSEIFYTLAREIVSQDASEIKHRHPEYHSDPIKEINYSLKLLESDTQWKLHYETFINAMLFDNAKQIIFDDAIHELKEISKSFFLLTTRG